MRLTDGWWRSKTLWTATLPAVVAAVGAWAQGQVTWWQALLMLAGGGGAFGVREALVRGQQVAAVEHRERMASVTRTAQQVKQAQAQAQQAQAHRMTMEDLVTRVSEEFGRRKENEMVATLAREPEDGECEDRAPEGGGGGVAS